MIPYLKVCSHGDAGIVSFSPREIADFQIEHELSTRHKCFPAVQFEEAFS